jgi:lipid-A-disaccharide synthase-like uncharacterized protein
MGRLLTFKTNKMKQKVWELWFLVSAVVFGAFFFVGTIEGSQEAFPNFFWGFIPALFNLAVCLLYGIKPTK